jgi:putative transposase
VSLYKNKYRVESIRLKNLDYSTSGFYFITICTKERECFFGEIVEGKMILSEPGKIIQNER